MLKECGSENAPILAYIYESLAHGAVSDDWLQANVAPVIKKAVARDTACIPGPKIKFCLFAIAYLPTIFPPTQKILLGFLEFFFFF